MPVGNAKVRIKIKGLGFCYHKAQTNPHGEEGWEILFLRDIQLHQLIISITPYNLNGMPMMGLHQKKNISVNTRLIKIKTTKPQTVSNPSYLRNPFNWDVTTNDKQDLRWMPDLDAEFHKQPIRVVKPSGKRLTFLHIPDSIFYTDTLTKHPPITGAYLEYPILKNNLPYNNYNGTNKRVLGDIVGADINWADVNSKTEIMVTGSPNLFNPMTNNPQVSYYEVFIDNSCNNPNCKDYEMDWLHYYDYLNMPDRFEVVLPDAMLDLKKKGISLNKLSKMLSRPAFSAKVACNVAMIGRLNGNSLSEI